MEIETISTSLEEIECDGIVLWTFEDRNSEIIDRIGPSIKEYFDAANFQGKEEQEVLLFNLDNVKAPRVILIGIGKQDETSHEIIRKSIGNAVRKLEKFKCDHIAVEAVNGDGQSTAEGVFLALYEFNELKTKKDDETKISKVTFSGTGDTVVSWNNGVIISQSQNEVRRLSELPANIGTPSYFVNQAKNLFEGIAKTTVITRDEEWAKENNMNVFLSVTAGTDEPAKFLEIHYNGGIDDAKPIVFVGKGITFDTGGISIKPSSGMGLMRTDCTGAANVIGVLYGIAKLGLKVNVIGLAPLTENMPSGKATKPSDVIYASNGKSVEIDNTDAEGRLVLADALVYAETFNPHTVIDIATLTGAMMRALGNTFTGVFARDDKLWDELETAGLETYERFWRMPMDDAYKKKLKSNLADLKNVGGVYGGASIAAMFLGEFVENQRWAHIDIAGSMIDNKRSGYKPEGIPGVPARALIQFVRNLS